MTPLSSQSFDYAPTQTDVSVQSHAARTLSAPVSSAYANDNAAIWRPSLVTRRRRRATRRMTHA